MADQHRWFKLWCSAPSDDHIQTLPPSLRWAWAAFGAYTKLHGSKGEVSVSATNRALAAELGVTVEELIPTLKLLPNVCVIESENSHDRVSVTWKNWVRYQEDTTQAERQRTSRAKKRGDENKKRVPPSLRSEWPGEFMKFYGPYPKHEDRAAAEKAWAKLEREAEQNPGLLSAIVSAVDRQKLSQNWLKDNGAFIPLPSTWLNKRRWENEVAVPSPVRSIPFGLNLTK